MRLKQRWKVSLSCKEKREFSANSIDKQLDNTGSNRQNDIRVNRFHLKKFCIVLLIIENMKLSTLKIGHLEPKNKSYFLQIFSNLKLTSNASIAIVSIYSGRELSFSF